MTGLSLHDHNVTGTLLADLRNLEYLQSIDFSDNSVTGKVEDWVCKLSFFDLRNNGLDSLSCSVPWSLREKRRE